MDTKASDPIDTPGAAALTPLLSFYEMQHDLLKLNLAASAEFSKRSLLALDVTPKPPVANAPMQMFAFMTDCMRLSMSPVSIFAAASLSPFARAITKPDD